MSRPITDNSIKKYILEGVETILDISERAESVTFTVKIDKKTVPTISYKINGFPLIIKRGGDVNDT